MKIIFFSRTTILSWPLIKNQQETMITNQKHEKQNKTQKTELNCWTFA